MLAYSVRLRRGEIGLRMALGASSTDARALVVNIGESRKVERGREEMQGGTATPSLRATFPPIEGSPCSTRDSAVKHTIEPTATKRWL